MRTKENQMSIFGGMHVRITCSTIKIILLKWHTWVIIQWNQIRHVAFKKPVQEKDPQNDIIHQNRSIHGPHPRPTKRSEPEAGTPITSQYLIRPLWTTNLDMPILRGTHVAREITPRPTWRHVKWAPHIPSRNSVTQNLIFLLEKKKDKLKY